MADRRKQILTIVAIIHIVLVSLTLRDLGRRPDASVRGPKRLWRTWAVLNTTGSIAYWTIGRRRAPEPESAVALVELVAPE
jgi:hypothetical protein